MQNFIKFLQSHNELKVIDEPLDIELEIPHLAYLEVKKKDSKALLFTNPISKMPSLTTNNSFQNLSKSTHDKHSMESLFVAYNDSDKIQKFHIPVLMNVFGSQRRLELIATHYQCDIKARSLESIAQEIKNLMNFALPKSLSAKIAKLKDLWKVRHVFPKRYKGSPPCQTKIFQGDTIDLFSLPILKTWEEDGGRFITMGQVYTQGFNGESRNVGMYRLQVKSKDELIMHWQIHKDGMHFFHEYKRANKPMPVSIAIGGDPLYIWCGQAPMPPKVFELMLYGLIRNKNAKLAQCVSNELSVPYDCDIVIEGFVDTNYFAPEGKFGDHTGFYTPIESYPVMKIKAITTKHEPIYLATVVGKPPLEDKYMGYMTERLFLPLLQMTTHGLIDYAMPENGVFHNLIFAKVQVDYPAQSLQIMHAFFGIGQMSFVKHALFLSHHAPSLHNDYKILTDYILNRIGTKQLYVTQGICDALDHACENFAISGKLGIDASGEEISFGFKSIDSGSLLQKMQIIAPEIKSVHIYPHKNPIIICGIQKNTKPIFAYLERFYGELYEYGQFFIFVDDTNDLENYYMLVWRIVNSIDVQRDLKIISHNTYANLSQSNQKNSHILDSKDSISQSSHEPQVAFLDATAKSNLEGYNREWPKDTNCTESIIVSLKNRGLLDGIDETFFKRFGILK
ncbi:menaquinone biosynthesis decarboxylase [Helicobacter didelphidarum]|uniref:Menaquinone biosynthesis decarboxylase n=1 Tax=Helicobacter didelphidarum TaxID=2040648 RepID=A0A3D8ILI9_9HELI|nr:menaquinone biosynthesis decarboxylase [Helicobacter didelphidarum]RDU65870.1 menaquinone biosynthesis decarboxylase [Helicobacter didelphidarum]